MKPRISIRACRTTGGGNYLPSGRYFGHVRGTRIYEANGLGYDGYHRATSRAAAAVLVEAVTRSKMLACLARVFFSGDVVEARLHFQEAKAYAYDMVAARNIVKRGR